MPSKPDSNPSLYIFIHYSSHKLIYLRLTFHHCRISTQKNQTLKTHRKPMDFELQRKMEIKGVSVPGGVDQELLFNRNLSRNPSVGCSSRIYYCRSSEGVPFNWEMQPGTPRNPPKEEAIPPISPPPAALSLGLPKPYMDQQPNKRPPTSPLPRLKFWRKSKKNKQRKNNVHDNVNYVAGGSDKFDKVEFCSSDSEFMASTSPHNSSPSSSSSFSFSKGRLSRQCSSLQSTQARESFSSSGHFSCSPWKFSSVLISIARRV
ncbi:uncharacterized protein LOC110753477 [Prunus avium]|uniref:Uncharacterized protein LOC110753477 n=1 Tax=Prunus avium TaxID=42229 RepID=A0A6P5S382_PRUAV|nr:uncharacterized protein LOC110753477 [Prunus avium]